MKDLSKTLITEAGLWIAGIAAITAFGNAFTMSEEKRNEQTTVGVASAIVVAAVTAVCVVIVEKK